MKEKLDKTIQSAKDFFKKQLIGQNKNKPRLFLKI